MISEDQDTRTLLIHEIQSQDIYQRQGGILCLRISCYMHDIIAYPFHFWCHTKLLHAEETIITWSDAEIGTDVALSFQEADGCNSVWCALLVLNQHDCAYESACTPFLSFYQLTHDNPRHECT